MESELDLLIGTAINSLLKLEVLLYFEDHPGAAQTADEIGVRLSRPREELKTALEELSQAGLIERFALGSGRHVVYGSADDPHVREVLGALEARYRRADSRAGLVRQIVSAGRSDEAETEPEQPG